MNKFINGKEINEENLVAMIKESMAENWKNADILEWGKQAMDRIATKQYEGRQDDIEYILEKLNWVHADNTFEHIEPNLQNVDIILIENKGDWNFEKSTSIGVVNHGEES